MTAIDITKIRNTITQLLHDGEQAHAHKMWDLLDAYHQLQIELTHKYGDSSVMQEIDHILRAQNLQHSQIAGQTVLGCLSHIFDNDTNLLVRCQTPNGHHDMHTHCKTSGHVVHRYYWNDDEAFTKLKDPSEQTQ